MVLAIRRRTDVKPFTTLAVVFLALIALAQATRFLLGWEVTIHGFVVPVWLSGIAFLIAGGIAAMLWWESHRQV
jgi:protein-S-isoprenylcysteine O-methyltransferase Ste14